jgi:hypothetical protein
MSKLLVLALDTVIANSDFGDVDCWLERIEYPDERLKETFELRKNEVLYYAFCGGRCVSASFPKKLKYEKYHDNLANQNKKDYNLLLRKMMIEISKQAKIVKILTYESEKNAIIHTVAYAEDIDNILSQWQGDILYKTCSKT